MYATAIALGGFTVREAADGRQALSMALEWIPDVLVTDLEGPRLDGFQLIGWLRANQPTAQIVVVVLTGHSDERARRRASELDAAFVLKPCLPDTLIAHIVAALGRGGRGIPGADARTSDTPNGPARRTLDSPHKRG
jgi:two-component system, chemotaxis family, chemotaxis protein CheY